MDLPYDELPPPPTEVRAGAILARLVDGAGFRYRWATEGLDAGHATFRAGPGCFTIGEVLAHQWRLVRWIDRTLRGALGAADEGAPTDAPSDVADLRRETLATLVGLRALFLETSDARLGDVAITGTPSRGPEPFWAIVNGPLADFLTHVGQVAASGGMARVVAQEPSAAASAARARAM